MKTLQVQAEAVAPVSTSGRWALASLALPMLLSALGTSIANVGLPTLVQAFDASFQAVQWVVLAYLLAATTLVVSAGRLGDALGRRRAARLLGTGLWKGGDQGIIDGLAINGSAAVVGGVARLTRMVQTGHLYWYALVMLLGVFGFLTWRLWPTLSTLWGR